MLHFDGSNIRPRIKLYGFLLTFTQADGLAHETNDVATDQSLLLRRQLLYVLIFRLKEGFIEITGNG